jgi:hypothetical protein
VFAEAGYTFPLLPAIALQDTSCPFLTLTRNLFFRADGKMSEEDLGYLVGCGLSLQNPSVSSSRHLGEPSRFTCTCGNHLGDPSMQDVLKLSSPLSFTRSFVKPSGSNVDA